MLRFLRFLITGDWHLHKWETIARVSVYALGKEEGMPRNYDYECRCERCGAIKKFRV